MQTHSKYYTLDERTDLGQESIDRNPNLLIPWYLMASYAYYQVGVTLISDELYEEICQRLAYLFLTLRHQHKNLMDRKALAAGTGHYIPAAAYSLVTKHAAMAMVSPKEKGFD